jgi:hypothetical protein
MSKLTKELSNIFKGLAFQYADDYLSTAEKLKQLNVGIETHATTLLLQPNITNTAARRRIAFVTNGKGTGSPFDYVIDACLGQRADLDILFYGPHLNEHFFTDRARRAGISSRVIDLAGANTQAIVDYMRTQPSLIYMVTITGDPLIKTLIEQQAQLGHLRLYIPLVMIEDRDQHRMPVVAAV